MEPATSRSRAGPGDPSAGELPQQLTGKYMTFKLADEVYGFEILKVRELIGLMPITRIPRTPDHVRGIINLRGKVIPVLDLRLEFGMARTEPTEQTVIIVVQCSVQAGELTMGILVDQVLEVLSIEAGQIEPTPAFGAGAPATDFILGVGKTAHHVVLLLDIGRVLTEADARALTAACRAEPGPA